MATTIMILGDSGTGKSASLRNLDRKKSVLLNVLGKPLPFKGGNEFHSVTNDDPKSLNGLLVRLNDRKDKQVVVVDDFQYVMANMWMKSLLEPRTKDSEFTKYKEIGYHAWTLIRTAQNVLRKDMMVFFLAHTDVDINGKTRCKTIGKMLDEKINLEGMFTIVLNTFVHQDRPVSERYCFQTQNNGCNTTKSPMGMFDSEEISNDLQIVVNSIQSYYGGVM